MLNSKNLFLINRNTDNLTTLHIKKLKCIILYTFNQEIRSVLHLSFVGFISIELIQSLQRSLDV